MVGKGESALTNTVVRILYGISIVSANILNNAIMESGIGMKKEWIVEASIAHPAPSA